MKMRSIFLVLAFCVLCLATSLAENPNMGTWKLNEGKSKIASGAPKNTTVVYSMDGDNVKVTTDGTGPDGQPMHTEWTGKFDGKDYPLTGDSTADSRAYTQVNDHTLMVASKKDGKPIAATVKIVVARDGKTRMVTVSGKDANGKKIESKSAYDKQ